MHHTSYLSKISPFSIILTLDDPPKQKREIEAKVGRGVGDKKVQDWVTFHTP